MFQTTNKQVPVGMLRTITCLALSLLLVACGTSTRTTSDTQSRNPDKINVSDLPYPIEVMTAYDIVRRYNANWLRKRGRSSIEHPNPIRVYLDNTSSPLGGIDALRNINGIDIESIERFGAREAQLHFGVGHTSGALLVRTRGTGE